MENWGPFCQISNVAVDFVFQFSRKCLDLEKGWSELHCCYVVSDQKSLQVEWCFPFFLWAFLDCNLLYQCLSSHVVAYCILSIFMYLNFYVLIGLVGKRNTTENNSLWTSRLQGTRLHILPYLLHFLKASWCAVVKILCASDELLKGWSITDLRRRGDLGCSAGKGTGVVTSSSSGSEGRSRFHSRFPSVSQWMHSLPAGCQEEPKTQYCKRFRVHVYHAKSCGLTIS